MSMPCAGQMMRSKGNIVTNTVWTDVIVPSLSALTRTAHAMLVAIFPQFGNVRDWEGWAAI